ncbi:hypothetical protein B0I35DRAFT_359887 [Stachybotrys elegans]|uniref:Uncharacterized protein n=1 Tax=Stachybotrys elegans TaxID=80388 RepID=A0A8K0SIB6_9HYPO|nr:hypothetical protein B0I35DRAFT_359887 [Stachybotrys elegans]
MATCRRCHSAGLPKLFRNLKITPKATQTLLRSDVDKLLGVLGSAQSLAHVRSVTICGSMPEATFHPSSQTHQTFINTANTSNLPRIPTQQDYYAGLEYYWDAVAKLFQTLPYPTDVIWDSVDAFPACLLNVIHRHTSHCRIHIRKLKFRSLRLEVTHERDLALVSSPHLHSICVTWSGRYSSGDDDHHYEAAVRVLQGLAPNLKEVRMMYRRPPASPALFRAMVTPRQPWKGFTGVGDEDARQGALESLALLGETRATPRILEEWANYTDFELLRHLTLMIQVSGGALRWASSNLSLPNLKELRISLDRDDVQEKRPGFADDAIAFFDSLPPLTTLDLSGALEQKILQHVLRQHGATLKNLTITPYESKYSTTKRNLPLVLTNEDFDVLQSSCPNVMKLKLPVKRRKGNASEVAIYQALGRMKSLTDIYLTLDCSAPWVTQSNEGSDGPANVGFDGRTSILGNVKPHHIRDSMINCATDALLAEAIWRTISEGKTGYPVHTLTIKSRGGTDFGSAMVDTALSDYIDHLSRSYKVSRAVRDDDNTFSIVEEDRVRREERDDRVRLIEIARDESGHMDGSTMAIYRKTFEAIWPKKEGSRDWRDDWQSFPLCPA